MAIRVISRDNHDNSFIIKIEEDGWLDADPIARESFINIEKDLSIDKIHGITIVAVPDALFPRTGSNKTYTVHAEAHSITRPIYMLSHVLDIRILHGKWDELTISQRMHQIVDIKKHCQKVASAINKKSIFRIWVGQKLIEEGSLNP